MCVPRLQIFADRTASPGYIDRGMMDRISGFALDFTIVTAITTMRTVSSHSYLYIALHVEVWFTFIVTNFASSLELCFKLIAMHFFKTLLLVLYHAVREGRVFFAGLLTLSSQMYTANPVTHTNNQM